MSKEDDEVEEEKSATVSCGTSAGPIKMKLYREWSPLGYDRAVELFERGFYDNSHFFRTVPGFLVQFGITYSDDMELKRFGRTAIPDDEPVEGISFKEGTISYAGGGANSRTSQLFFAYAPSKALGTNPWETPIGKIIEGMENVRNFYGGYGDMPPWGKGPVQGRVYSGPSYIEDNFPKTSRFETCTVEHQKVKSQTMEEENKEEEYVEEDDKKEVVDDDETAATTTADDDESDKKEEGTMKKQSLPIGNNNNKSTNLLRSLKSKMKMEDSPSNYGLITISAVFVIFLLAISIKISRGRKKTTGKTS